MNIKDAIEDDLMSNMTPDLVSLRYFGDRIPVFLWDNLRDYSTFNANLKGLGHNDYRFVHNVAITEEAFVPWYSIGTETKDCYEAYCLRDFDDLEYTDCDDYMVGQPRGLAGKVVALSLKTLQQLDQYYENEFKFERHLIDVRPKAFGNSVSKKIEVFAYFNDLEDVATFNNEKKLWSIHKDLDFTPFREKDNVYEM